MRLKCKKFAFRLLQELKKTSNPIYSYSFQRKIYTSILIAKKIIGTPMAFSVLRLFEISLISFKLFEIFRVQMEFKETLERREIMAKRYVYCTCHLLIED